MSSVPVTRGFRLMPRWSPAGFLQIQFLLRCAFDFQAQRDGFADTLGNFVERARLSAAGGNLRNRGYIIALWITLYHDIELA